MRVATARGDVEVRTNLNDPLVGLTGQNLANYLGGEPGGTWGKPMNAEKAIGGTIAVYACVSLLAEVIGSLPLKLYRRDSAGKRTIVEHDAGARGLSGRGYPGTLARLLGEMPNSEMSAQDLWETVVGHGALWGNAYVQVVRDGSARPVELWPLRPDRMEVFRVRTYEDGQKLNLRKGEKFYSYDVGDGQKKRLDAAEVMHVKWYGTDGLVGISPIGVARNVIAGDQAQQDYQGKFYANSAMPGSLVTIPRRGPTEFGDRAKTYREHLEGLYGGASNRGRIAVVEEGVTWQAVQMSMKDMEFITTAHWNVTQLARLWRIPPHMVGDVERSTSWGTGIESQWMSFLATTLRPILERCENAMNRSLGLTPGEKTLMDERLYPEFETEALLRADSATRWSAYTAARQLGVLNATQIAAIENLPFDAARPSDYDNPNVTAAPTAGTAPTADVMPMPQAQPQAASSTVEVDYRDEENARTDILLAAVAKMSDMHAEDMKAITAVKRAEAVGLPDVHVSVPEAIVSERQLPPAVVQMDTQPFADAVRFFGKTLAEMDAKAEARDAQLREVLTPRPTKRVIDRDEHSNIISIREVPDEEAV